MSDYTPTTKTVLAYIRGNAVMAGATANEAQDAAVGWLASVERRLSKFRHYESVSGYEWEDAEYREFSQKRKWVEDA